MKLISTDLRLAALGSFSLVLPFMILEFLHTTLTGQNVPGLIILFGLLWLLPMGFIRLLLPVVRKVRAGNRILAKPLRLLFRAAFLVLLVIVWGNVLIDQMPCFMGIPNCD